MEGKSRARECIVRVFPCTPRVSLKNYCCNQGPGIASMENLFLFLSIEFRIIQSFCQVHLNSLRHLFKMQIPQVTPPKTPASKIDSKLVHFSSKPRCLAPWWCSSRLTEPGVILFLTSTGHLVRRFVGTSNFQCPKAQYNGDKLPHRSRRPFSSCHTSPTCAWEDSREDGSSYAELS